jgi:hypothetical protein
VHEAGVVHGVVNVDIGVKLAPAVVLVVDVIDIRDAIFVAGGSSA